MNEKAAGGFSGKTPLDGKGPLDDRLYDALLDLRDELLETGVNGINVRLFIGDEIALFYGDNLQTDVWRTGESGVPERWSSAYLDSRFADDDVGVITDELISEKNPGAQIVYTTRRG